MKTFLVTGSHPGDGGVVQAEDHVSAVTQYIAQDCSPLNTKEVLLDIRAEVEKIAVDQGPGVKQFGDYTVREVH
jgi:hypothetical protein